MTGWTENNNQLEADFEFKNFVEAWSFMSKVALLAEKMDHHPNWSNTYNRVHISLSTHDAGGTVTWKDWELAENIKKLV